MRLQQCSDPWIDRSRNLNAPARSSGVSQRPLFQDDPLVEWRGIVGVERAGGVRRSSLIA
jgi:hypothetical protein